MLQHSQKACGEAAVPGPDMPVAGAGQCSSWRRLTPLGKQAWWWVPGSYVWNRHGQCLWSWCVGLRSCGLVILEQDELLCDSTGRPKIGDLGSLPRGLTPPTKFCQWHGWGGLSFLDVSSQPPESVYSREIYLLIFKKLFYVCEGLACVYTCVLCVDSACGGSEEGTGSPRTRVTDDCELWCGDWELNPGPKPEQAVLLTIELPLQVSP